MNLKMDMHKVGMIVLKKFSDKSLDSLERRDANNMICENCKCKDDCGWYGSYKRIEMEIYTGIGTDNTLGRALIEVMRENNLEECEYFE